MTSQTEMLNEPDQNGIELWDEEVEPEKNTVAVDVCSEENSRVLRVYLFFLFMFQTLFKLSDNALNVLLNFFSLFIHLLAKLFTLRRLFSLKLPKTVTKKRP